MKLAFVLFRYVPWGGLQKDFMKVARECQERGHSVSVFTMAWEGDLPDGFDLNLITPRGLTNYRRCRAFAEELKSINLQSRYDLVVGFNKMSGLDVYFASDPCFVAKTLERLGAIYRLSARYRGYEELEKGVFRRGGITEILLLNPAEQERFVACYQTESERFHLMPPGIRKRHPDSATDAQVRREQRQSLALSDDDRLLLMVGSNFKTKGVDRSIRALADLPVTVGRQCRLLVLGNGNAAPLQRLAQRLGVAEQVIFGGTHANVSPYYLAADLLLHPSRTEAAGMVLIEALTHGLPVLATDVCGYAFHVEQANAGQTIPSPFEQSRFVELLGQMLTKDSPEEWRTNGLIYAANTDLYSLPQKAVDYLEKLGRRQGGHD